MSPPKVAGVYSRGVVLAVAGQGESCYDEAKWAKTDGVFAHKSWYPGLTADSSIAEFQASTLALRALADVSHA